MAPIVIAAYAGMSVQFLKPKNGEEIYTPERDGPCPRKSFFRGALHRPGFLSKHQKILRQRRSLTKLSLHQHLR